MILWNDKLIVEIKKNGKELSNKLKFQGLKAPDLSEASSFEEILKLSNGIYLKEGFPLVEHEDYAFWLNLFKKEKKLKAESLNDNLAFYRVHDNNLTKSKVKVILWVFKVFYRSL